MIRYSLQRLLSCLSVFFAINCNNASIARADVYDDLRAKWSDSLTGGPDLVSDAHICKKIAHLDDSARTFMRSMEPVNSDKPYLFSDFPNVAWGPDMMHSHITATYARLAAMALTLRTKGSSLEFTGSGSRDAVALRDAVKRGLAWMHAYAYQANSEKADPANRRHNWWDLEIGATGWLGNILTLLTTGPFAHGSNGALTQEQIDAYSTPMILKQRSAKPDYAGANGAWQCRTWMLIGILRRNRDENGRPRDFIEEARERLDGFLAKDAPDVYTWNSEGFQPDGSFLGHRCHCYTGGYGHISLSLLSGLNEFFSNTPYALNGNLATNLVRWLSGCDLSMYRLQYFQCTRGRELTRYREDALTGKDTVLAAIRIAKNASTATHPGAETTEQIRLRQMILQWIDATPEMNLSDDAEIDIPAYVRLRDFLERDAATLAPRSPLDTCKQFPYASVTVVHRPAYAAAVAMFTKDDVGRNRPHIKSNEVINGETPQGAFLSNGALQLITNDTNQYADGYYENLDWSRIPGTTIDSAIKPSGLRYENASNYAGGVTLGRYGVTGFQLEPKPGASAEALGKFHARKAWFFFDKEIVALGSDIRTTDATVAHEIHTTVANTRLCPDNSNTFKIDDSSAPRALAAIPATLSSARLVRTGATRAWLQGNVPNSDTGYYFPEPVDITLRREYRISEDSNVKTPSANFLTMWINHGVPTAGKYSYVLLPNHDEAATATYADNPEICVLENSPDAQAVRKSALGLTGALFLKNQHKTICADGRDFLSSDRIAAVIVEELHGTITIAVADPTWENTDVINLELFRGARSVESKTPGVTVLQTTPTIKLRVDVRDAKGAIFCIKMSSL